MKPIRTLSDFISRKRLPAPQSGLPIDERMALVTHYLHNRGTAFGTNYESGRDILIDLVGREDPAAFMDGIENTFQPAASTRFTFIDLFAGIGGFRLAMQNLGGRCVFSSEINPKAQKTYAFNYGEVPFGDIIRADIKALIPPGFDVLCAGFPCQAFSIAGYRKGFEDTRGTLFFEIAEIIRSHRPKAVLLENVRNLKTHDNGHTFEVIRNTLNDLGYSVSKKVLGASVYANVPQRRERIIIVAFDREAVCDYKSFRFPKPIKLSHDIHDCIEPGQKPESYYYRAGQQYYDQLVRDMTSADTIYQWRRVYCRTNKRQLCPTLTANMGAGGHNVPLILTPEGIRKITPKECLNFMGYPAEFEFPQSVAEYSRYIQAGNSVVPPMIERVGAQMIRVIMK